MTPQHIIFVSGGNDSVALVEYAHIEGLHDVVLAYSNTGWAAKWWPLRMERFKAWAESYGFDYHEIHSEGMEALIRRKKGWPANRPKFCTFELKIQPAQAWMGLIDPLRQAVCMVGIRRCESRERRNWPLVVESSESHGGRELWSPLVEYSDADRDELVIQGGWEVLPHRSKECSPCVNANRGDFRKLDDDDVARVLRNEAETGRNMFRPHRFMGATGFTEVMRWAWSERGKYAPEESGCDSGMCGG